MAASDPTSRSDTAEARPPSRAFAWRPTWPMGQPDDLVTDPAHGGWARMKRTGEFFGPSAWEWTIGGRPSSRTGRAGSREAAEEALPSHLKAAPRT